MSVYPLLDLGVAPALPNAQSARRQRYSELAPRISQPVVTGIVQIADAFALIVGLLAGLMLNGLSTGPSIRLYVFDAMLSLALTLAFLHMAGAYRFKILQRFWPSIGRSAGAQILASLCLLGILNLVPDVSEAEWLVLQSAQAFGLTALLGSHAAAASYLGHCARTGRLTRRVAIYGATPVAERLIVDFAKQEEREQDLIGLFDDRHGRSAGHCAGQAIVGTVEDLLTQIRQGRVDLVFIALPLATPRRIAQLLNALSHVAVVVRLCPMDADLQLGQVTTRYVLDHAVANVLTPPLQDWQGVKKAIEDKVLGSLILILIAPLMIAIGVLIRFDSPGPALFRQKRFGLNNKLFDVFKFRTMYQAASDPRGEKLTQRNDPRVTRLGAFLRRTSLDELPQFLNVVLGDMSIVGPRPHAVSAKAGAMLYHEAVGGYDARHRMKPGITGWAQVNGWRGETQTIEQIVGRVRCDLFYIENWSLLMDLRIILKTLRVGFTSRQAY